MTFDTLGLSEPILKAIKEKGYTEPSPIQAQAIPAVLTGKDVMAAAQTGTGKTASFTLPILEHLSGGDSAKANQAKVLVLTPTRELAAQIDENINAYSKHLSLKSTVVFGGVKINPQMMRLRKGVDILVATPGRLLDLYSQNAISFEQLEILVLDEADRMLDMGFIHDIRKVLAVLPEKRQNLMFSATFSDDIRKLAKTIVNDPTEISVTPPNSTVNTVKHWLIPVDKKRKAALLTHLLKENSWPQVLVFSRTKHGANRLTTQLLKEGIEASAIHGNKSQGARTKALAGFKSGKIRVLVATDIAARGIDISQLPYVINVDLPNVPEDYVHRIGRTGRAGAEGEAISLVSADEIKQLSDIERLIKKLIEREYEPGFEPEHELPESKLDTRPIKAKKPKKPKATEDEREPSRNNQRRARKPEEGRGRSARNSKQPNGRGRNGSGRTNNERTGRSDQRHPQKAQSRPLPVVRDENGDVNGNLAGVETHYSDNDYTKPNAGKNNSKRHNRNGGKPATAGATASNRGRGRGKPYAGKKSNPNGRTNSTSNAGYGSSPTPKQGGTGYQISSDQEKPTAYVGGGGGGESASTTKISYKRRPIGSR